MRLIKKSWRRRDFLRAAGISAAAGAVLPMMPAIQTQAQTGGLKRLLLLSHGNGSVLERWRDNGPGQAFEDGSALPQLQGPILSSLNPYRDRMLLLDGIDLSAVHDDDGMASRRSMNAGHNGSSVIFTGVNGGGQRVQEDRGIQWPGSPSIDHVMNEQIGEGNCICACRSETVHWTPGVCTPTTPRELLLPWNRIRAWRLMRSFAMGFPAANRIPERNAAVSNEHVRWT